MLQTDRHLTAILKVVINGNLQDEPSHPLSSLKVIINGNLQAELPYPENVYNIDMNMSNVGMNWTAYKSSLKPS